METPNATVLTVKSTINAPLPKVWDSWTKPEHITKWCFASDDWHSPSATSDLRTGGTFTTRMEARDGSMGFDFGGSYTEVRNHEYIESLLGDGRTTKVHFSADGDNTLVTELFEAENTNPIEMQQAGWQAILDNFKKYTEAI
jgi:uncharacterized protein YndB with AHSA1/START domain